MMEYWSDGLIDSDRFTPTAPKLHEARLLFRER